MKKLVLTLAALSTSVAFADHHHNYNNSNNGGFTTTQTVNYSGGFQGGSQGTNMTVKQALSARDDSMVTLVGRITQQICNDDYLFTDGTGAIKIEIKHRLWNGLTVTPDDKLRIYGKVDNDLMEPWDRTEVEVISIEKVQ